MQLLMTSAVGIEKPLVYKENTEAKGLLLYVRIGLTYRCQSLRFVQAQSGSNGQEMTASGESKLQTNQPEINRQCHRFHVKKKKRKKDNTLTDNTAEAIIELMTAAQL